jgi:hypothetical protein|nr:hypothetical protein [Candidatus Krumholzibacteria bacterium]
MKRVFPAAVALILIVGLLAASDAQAGLFDRWGKDKKDKEEQAKVAPRYDHYPSMVFHSGLLGRDVGTGWTVDSYRLILAKDCVITSEVPMGDGLDEGREALIMGSRLGDTIVAWRVKVKAEDGGFNSKDPNIKFVPSEVDPTVGEGSGPE